MRLLLRLLAPACLAAVAARRRGARVRQRAAARIANVKLRSLTGERQGRGAHHVHGGATGGPRRVLVWGAVERASAVRGGSAGALPVGLRRRLGQVPAGEVLDTLQESLPALRRAAAADARRRLQGAERLLLDDPGVAAPAAAARLRSLASAAHELGASRRPLVGRATRPRGPSQLDVRRQVAGRVRPLQLPRRAGLRVRLQREGRAQGQVRPEPVHRHPQLRVRVGLEARVGDPDAQGHRDVLPQLRPAAAVLRATRARRCGRPRPASVTGSRSAGRE